MRSFFTSPLIWIAWKLLFNKRALLKSSLIFSFIGLVAGVGSLVVSMAVVSGFESTLREAIGDVTGHAQVIKRSRQQDNWQELENRIRQIEPTLVSSARFVFIEGLTAQSGQISTILVQGVDGERMRSVLNMKSRITEGQDDLSTNAEGIPSAFIGVGLAKKMNLKVGSPVKVVVPIADAINANQFRRRIGTFKVAAIMDFGKNEWNERFLIADLKAVQTLGEIGDRYTGLLLKFQDMGIARSASQRISQVLGASYWVRDWRDANENLFEAVVMERVVIFFVVLIIVLMVAFNIASTLFVSVVQRYSDIAILKTIGMTESSVLKLFSLQGLMIGIAGLILGTLFGAGLSFLFGWLENSLGLISGSVYKVDNIKVNIRFVDLAATWAATLIICFIATLAPARRGAKLNPVEGLRNG